MLVLRDGTTDVKMPYPPNSANPPKNANCGGKLNGSCGGGTDGAAHGGKMQFGGGAAGGWLYGSVAGVTVLSEMTGAPVPTVQKAPACTTVLTPPRKPRPIEMSNDSTALTVRPCIHIVLSPSGLGCRTTVPLTFTFEQAPNTPNSTQMRRVEVLSSIE